MNKNETDMHKCLHGYDYLYKTNNRCGRVTLCGGGEEGARSVQIYVMDQTFTFGQAKNRVFDFLEITFQQNNVWKISETLQELCDSPGRNGDFWKSGIEFEHCRYLPVICSNDQYRQGFEVLGKGKRCLPIVSIFGNMKIFKTSKTLQELNIDERICRLWFPGIS